jgi:hypothetical protein
MGPSNMCKNLLIIVIITTITSKNRIITTTGVFFFGGEISQLHDYFFQKMKKKPENYLNFRDFSRHFSKLN